MCEQWESPFGEPSRKNMSSKLMTEHWFMNPSSGHLTASTSKNHKRTKATEADSSKHMKFNTYFLNNQENFNPM